VTSSGTTAAGIVAGVDGLPITAISDVLGIFKLPMTRVGKGPFVTRLTEDEEPIRRKLAGNKGVPGAEFGATSGRDRDIGWFDLVAARYAIQMAGITEAALTKLDKYDGVNSIKTARHYKVYGSHTDNMPSSVADLEQAEPVYIERPGWSKSVEGTQNACDLDPSARQLIVAVERYLRIPVRYVGTGTGRNDLIRL